MCTPKYDQQTLIDLSRIIGGGKIFIEFDVIALSDINRTAIQ